MSQRNKPNGRNGSSDCRLISVPLPSSPLPLLPLALPLPFLTNSGSGKRPSSDAMLWSAENKEFEEEETRDEEDIDPLQELRLEYGGEVDPGDDDEEKNCEEDVEQEDGIDNPSKDEEEEKEEGSEAKVTMAHTERFNSEEPKIAVDAKRASETTPPTVSLPLPSSLSPLPSHPAMTSGVDGKVDATDSANSASPPKNAHPPLAETPPSLTNLPAALPDPPRETSALASNPPAPPAPAATSSSPAVALATAVAPSGSVKNRASLFSFMPRKNPALMDPAPEAAAVYSSNKPKIIPEQKMRQLHWIRLRPAEVSPPPSACLMVNSSRIRFGMKSPSPRSRRSRQRSSKDTKI
jgi:hypothetical protein